MTASREFLEELLADCLERRERGGDAAVEELLQEHPGYAPALRRYLAFLGESKQRAGGSAGELDEVEVGREIGDFRLIRPIGRGAMGEVWLAEQVSLLRRCALKLVDLRAISASARARFRLEARALARVESSHVVRVIASGEFEDIGYLAMDLVEGQGLDEVLRTEPGPVLAEIVRHGRDVARALAAVHDAGLVHRDLKPSNIRINEAGEAVLIDFGLARDLRADAAGLSMSGAFIGTPCYAAPEQLTGEDQDIGPWTDVYGLGVSLYECVARERPFRGKTPEQVFRQILMAEPEPLRNLRPSASADLATVISKSMEKEPSRRYRSATELAQDLQAVLELRPISAQPAGTLRRMRRWTRRHRLTSGVILALALGLLLVVATVTIEGMKARQDRAQRANDLVADAGLALERFRLTQSEVELALRRRNEIVRLMPYRHLAVEEIRELDELEADLEANEGRRQELFFDMLESLRRAEDLDAEVPRLEETRAAVYLEQWRLAVAAGSNGLARFYGERVRASDRSGRFETELAGETRLVVKVHPRDAEVHLFRILPEHELDGRKVFRNVAVPFGQALGARPTVTTDGTPRPGQTCLRVLRGAKGIETDALITAVDGFPPLSPEAPPWRRIGELQPILTVYQRGRSEEVRTPVGLSLRPTANPLVPSADSLLTDPLAGESIRSGIWLLLVRSAGHASRRHLLTIAADTPAKIEIDLELDQAKLVPADFIRLQELRPTSQQDPRWMLDHEVTCGDYLEFLNDEITRARIEAAPTAILFPRTATNVEDGGYWTRDEHGRYQLGPGWTADMPVLGVSHEDATAYVAWKEAQLDEEGYDLDLRLPEQYDYLCSSSPAQRYVWGDRFRPHWSKSCHATEKPRVEEVLSYPIDESLGGHFDLAGSAQEWCEPWFAREQNERMLHGGSWAHARAERFVIDFVAGSPPDHAADTFGFRIVARPRR